MKIESKILKSTGRLELILKLTSPMNRRRRVLRIIAKYQIFDSTLYLSMYSTNHHPPPLPLPLQFLLPLLLLLLLVLTAFALVFWKLADIAEYI